ncbi:MAG: hypothetical protein R3D55_13520 [Chloroflexota bacterium]
MAGKHLLPPQKWHGEDTDHSQRKLILPEWMQTNRGIVWYTMRFVGSETAVNPPADLIVTNLLQALQR